MPPAQIDGTASAVPAYRLNARSKTKLSPANRAIAGVKSTAGLYGDK